MMNERLENYDQLPKRLKHLICIWSKICEGFEELYADDLINICIWAHKIFETLPPDNGQLPKIQIEEISRLREDGCSDGTLLIDDKSATAITLVYALWKDRREPVAFENSAVMNAVLMFMPMRDPRIWAEALNMYYMSDEYLNIENYK